MSIESYFPTLAGGGYRTTSPETEDYNCIAWAAGKSDEWWDIREGYYWPDGVPRVGTIKIVSRVFKLLGFKRCKTSRRLRHFDKIAIYGEGELFTHVARQLPSGKWTSKLGNLQDIEHDTLESLEGDEYGKLMFVMRRPAAKGK